MAEQRAAVALAAFHGLLAEMGPEELPAFAEAASTMLAQRLAAVSAGSGDEGGDSESEEGAPVAPVAAVGSGAGLGVGAGAATEPAPAVTSRLTGSPMMQLMNVRSWLRGRVPVSAELPSERIVYASTGEFSSYTAQNTVSVDGFLWEDADVDDLCDEGKLPRSYCTKCGSKDIDDMNFISHSLSRHELCFIFQLALPSVMGSAALADAAVVDVGSRLGAVLFGARLLGGVKQVTGIEINKDFCEVSKAAVQQFGLSDVAVIHDDILNQAEVLAAADVVVMHNAFQFFASPELSAKLWSFVARTVKRGALIVSSPSLEEQCACAEGDMPELGTWVREIKLAYPDAGHGGGEGAGEGDSDSEGGGKMFTDILCYRVTRAA